MSTIGMVVIKDEKNRKIVEIYNHFNSYPDGLGKIILDFIDSGELVNGLGLDEDKKQFNGINDFAAQFICHIKTGAGGVYLHAPSTDYKNKKKYQELYWAEYYYEIDSELNVKCWDTYYNKEIPLINGKFIEEEEQYE